MRISYLLGSLFVSVSSASAWEWEADVTLQWQRGFDLTLNGLGGFAPAGGDNGPVRVYDDGFVGMDNLNNVAGRTSHWSYASASQTPEGSQTVIFSRASAAADTTFADDLDAGRGIEIAGRAIFHQTERARYGLVLGAGYGRVHDDGAFSIGGLNATMTRDAYGYTPSRADFIDAAPPGFVGNTSGLGPLLHAAFDRSVGTENGVRSIDGNYAVEATSLSFSAGLSGEWRLARAWSLRLEAGMSLTELEAVVRLWESVRIGALTPSVSQTFSRESDWLTGYFGRVAVLYDIRENIALRLGVRFSDYGVLELPGARFDAGSLTFVEGGFTFRF